MFGLLELIWIFWARRAKKWRPGFQKLQQLTRSQFVTFWGSETGGSDCSDGKKIFRNQFLQKLTSSSEVNFLLFGRFYQRAIFFLDFSVPVFCPLSSQIWGHHQRVPNGVFQTVFFRFLTSAYSRGKPFQRDKECLKTPVL